MWEKFRAIFVIPELRQKIIFTLIMLAVFRIGYSIPLPIKAHMEMKGDAAAFFEKVAMLSAADMKRLTIFGLGIMPYISASIILQLLGSVWKPLEELRKEGEVGRKKINEYTRYLTLIMCFVQGAAYISLRNALDSEGSKLYNAGFLTDGKTLAFSWYITCLCMMTCGTMFVMWIGEQIDEFGIGNGISLLIMAGILAQMPQAFSSFSNNFQFTLGAGSGQKGVGTVIVLIVLFVLVVAGVVFMQLGQRQITTISAKHMRGGRRVYGGGKQYLPLRLNQSGVMPIIFASTLLLIPPFILDQLAKLLSSSSADGSQSGWGLAIQTLGQNLASPTAVLHNVLYIALIFFFSYFWTAITFNPKEMAENLKDYGTFIPGHRPGRRTAQYLENVMVRITYVGAAFLSLVAIIPTIVGGYLEVDQTVANFYGGTGLLIAVSVAFDLIQKIDSHLVMRDYRGLLEE